MEKAFNLASVIKTLRDGVEKGYWTIEDLDSPSPGSCYTRDLSGVTPSGHVSMVKPYMLKPHKNLLRISPDEDAVHVEIINPKDLTQAQKPTPLNLKNVSETKSINPSEPY